MTPASTLVAQALSTAAVLGIAIAFACLLARRAQTKSLNAWRASQHDSEPLQDYTPQTEDHYWDRVESRRWS